MKRQLFLRSVLAAVFSVSVSGLALADGKPFRVGVTPGPHAQIVEAAKAVAAKDGLDVEVIEFTNYMLPNQALASGELNANSFQHKPYLDNQVRSQGLKLVAISQSIAFPMGIYSRTLTDLKAVPEGAKVGVPNDPSNNARALILLQDAKLIELKPDFGINGTVQDIASNPHKLQFIEMDAAQLPRSLGDVGLAVIPTNYALDAGLNPKQDALILEPADSPYTGIIAVRESDKDNEDVAKFIRAYRSPEVKAFIETTFKGAILPTW
jgi:D-methionine transport system substrate-binding protein